MTKPITVLKSCGPKLVPFFKTCTIFFVLFADTPASETSQPWFFMVIKCLPIISLCLFVLLNGMHITEYYRYSRRVLIGLVFSCIGDACLVWKKSYFEVGIGCFAIAQISYSRAFGWKPFNPYAGGVFAILGSLMFYILSPALKGIMVYLVAAYVGVIALMGWRAVARVQFFGCDFVPWTKLSGCLGAIAFMISDFILAIDKFLVPVPYAHPLIMITYYAAQLGIAMSVVDSQVDEIMASSKRDERSREEKQMNGLKELRNGNHINHDVTLTLNDSQRTNGHMLTNNHVHAD